MTAHLPPWLRLPWVQGLLLLALTAAAYAGVSWAGFVFDDHPLVLYNPGIRELSSALGFFGQDLWATADGGAASGYYRPLMALSLALDWQLAGASPMLYHLHSLAWHLLAVWLLHRLLLALSSPLPALLGAALFALHPLQSEAVVWIAARNDLMAAALLLATLVALRPLELSFQRLAGGAALAVAAVLSKESTLLLPLFLLCLDLAEHGRPRGWPRHLVLWGSVTLHLAARFAAGINTAAAPSEQGWRLVAGKLPELLALAGGLLVWPHPLSVGRDLTGWGLGATALILGLTVVLLILVASLVSRQRLAWVGLGWAAMAFAPSVVAVADKGPFGERYLYTSLAGLALVLAAVVSALPPARRRWSALALLVVIPWFFVLHARVPDWKSDETLWRAAVRDTPCGYAHVSLGHVLNVDGSRSEALRWYRESLRVGPPLLGVCTSLIEAAEVSERLEGVAAIALEAHGRGCRQPDFEGRVATYLAMTGRWEEAHAMAAAVEDRDRSLRAALVVAAWRLVEGDCSRYRELREDWSGDLDAQMMLLFHHGGHSQLSRRALEGALCSEPVPFEGGAL
jgi:hypothetical protein